jgi:ubiquinone/menaquinone biosynthesis C-methylase UbiE
MASTFTRGMSLHAQVYDLVCGHMESIGLLEWRKALVGDLTGTAVELGCGTGKNLPHYPAGATVYASDYDPVMLSRAVERAGESAADVHLFVADAMRLPLADASVDTVVVGLMFCSVPEPDQALHEVRRVLRPGGALRLVEHVRDSEGTLRARIQDTVNPVWKLISGGCNANRRTAEKVEELGFEVDSLRRFQLGHSHLAPHVMVEARRDTYS